MKTQTEVQIQTSRSGHPVLILNGRATASLVDPLREARQWVQSQRKVLRSVQKWSRIVLLGIGSGYHLLELIQELKHLGVDAPETFVVGVDPTLQSVAFFHEHHKSQTDLKPEILSDTQYQPVANELVLKHRVSQIFNQEAYRHVEMRSIGRSASAWMPHLRQRTELMDQILIPVLEARSQSKPLLSLKDLVQAWKPEHESTDERRIFRVLEELVK